jgi:hypothetical protein
MNETQKRIEELEAMRLQEDLTQEEKTAITNELMELQAIRNNDAAFENAKASTESTVESAKVSFYLQLAGLIVSSITAICGLGVSVWVGSEHVKTHRNNVANGVDIDCNVTTPKIGM